MSTTTVTISSTKDSGTANPPSIPKINKQRCPKKSSDQADAADQLRLAQTLIGNLERQIQSANEDNRPGRDQTSVPKSTNGRPSRKSDGGTDDLSHKRQTVQPGA